MFEGEYIDWNILDTTDTLQGGGVVFHFVYG